MNIIVTGLTNAFQMFWEVWWALVLGFLLSGIVQAWVSRHRMERVLGGRSLAATLKATGLGAASSSCSYAAVAIAKSVFQKGAGLPATVAFMFASTNLVFELGIVLWIYLGPLFTLAEFLGGLVMILITWVVVRWTVSRKEEERAREHAELAQTGHVHGVEIPARTWREKLFTRGSWQDVAHNFVTDWRMLYRELLIGFGLAGFMALLPASVFRAAFLQDAPAGVRLIENVIIGPIVAILSFVCSVGNIPLAAVLWAGGISFAGVIAFIYADLITLPLILIYRKYYGLGFALKLTGIMFVTMVLAALAVEGLFSLWHLVPTTRPSIESIVSRPISLTSYTGILNIAFTVIGAALLYLNGTRPHGEHDHGHHDHGAHEHGDHHCANCQHDCEHHHAH